MLTEISTFGWFGSGHSLRAISVSGWFVVAGGGGGIDTAEKRRGVMIRRLPWFRRFTIPLPDGTISRADRYQLGFGYRGLVAPDDAIEAAGLFVERDELFGDMWQ